MNKLTGYTEFTLANGKQVEFKICNATYEIYGRALGLTTYEQISNSLTTQSGEGEKQKGVPELIYAGNLRQFMFAAAKYAAMAQNKPVNFNEWEVGEWLEEIGEDRIWNSIEQPPESVNSTKKKGKTPIIRATQ